MDEVIGHAVRLVVRGVIWLVTQILRLLMEFVVDLVVEFLVDGVKALWRRVRRACRRAKAPARVSLRKEP
ncbi:hypothetical protein C1I97_04630 [Streptomyces sp. NTH33]|uniref:hypothetical protein n=1 Tax=Streptomyces sp. NTH33 TaxID=1735453 RepID=UPI000DA97C82|nr:hypothetical protein [Streptomyces sp. NTH33]PZH17791.1 hypothetical protein C1I97_04630 [Streptomyces sp. NTH33]